MQFFIHETASVEDGATIGDGSSVWHHSQVRQGASIGANCVLGKNVFIDFHVHIGARCKIQNNVSVYHGVAIEDEVFVGPGAMFTNDLVPRAFASDWTLCKTKVRRGASIGANATIICGTEIGEFCMVGAGAVVTKSVESHSLVLGNPAKHVGWVCRCGQLVSRSEARPIETTCDNCKDEVE